MTDLTIPSKLTDRFPRLEAIIKQAANLFDSINSFEDVETYQLRGAGLSPNTYRSYLTAVRQLYEFTEGLNPLQVTPGHIEAFYDNLVKRVDRSTAYLRIRGLKKFFSAVEKAVPIWTNPFSIMSQTLHVKLNKTKRGNRTKKALQKHELRQLLEMLSQDESIQGLEDFALVLMLVTSGLRASELCQLRWKDLEHFENLWTCTFIGKGNQEAEQELYTPAVEACQAYFKKHFRRDPGPEDNLFYTIPVFADDEIRPMPYHVLWYRIHKVGEKARAEGIIKRELQISPHLFRRTYATLLYREGMKIRAIQTKTRHSNVETLMKHYVYDDDQATPYLTKIIGQVA
jgi:site-specific recombinase XerD